MTKIKDLPDKTPVEGDKVLVETSTGTGLAMLSAVPSAGGGGTISGGRTPHPFGIAMYDGHVKATTNDDDTCPCTVYISQSLSLLAAALANPGPEVYMNAETPTYSRTGGVKICNVIEGRIQLPASTKEVIFLDYDEMPQIDFYGTSTTGSGGSYHSITFTDSIATYLKSAEKWDYLFYESIGNAVSTNLGYQSIYGFNTPQEQVTSANYMFSRLGEHTTGQYSDSVSLNNELDNFDLPNCTSATHMFERINCSSFTFTKGLKLENVKDGSYMFANILPYTTSNSNKSTCGFSSCQFNLKSLTTAAHMFEITNDNDKYDKFSISNSSSVIPAMPTYWLTSAENLIDTSYMYYNCPILMSSYLTPSYVNFRHVENAAHMFENATIYNVNDTYNNANQDTNRLYFDNLVDASYMFADTYYCYASSSSNYTIYDPLLQMHLSFKDDENTKADHMFSKIRTETSHHINSSSSQTINISGKVDCTNLRDASYMFTNNPYKNLNPYNWYGARFDKATKAVGFASYVGSSNNQYACGIYGLFKDVTIFPKVTDASQFMQGSYITSDKLEIFKSNFPIVTNTSRMFSSIQHSYATSTTSQNNLTEVIIHDGSFPLVTDASYMFQTSYIDKITLGANTFQSVTNADYMFNGSYGGITGTETYTLTMPVGAFKEVLTAKYMFCNQNRVTTLEFSEPDAFSKIQDATHMFQSMSKIAEFTFPSDTTFYDTLQIADGMFYGCSMLTAFPLASTEEHPFTALTSAVEMFRSCTGVIDDFTVPSGKFPALLKADGMFRQCSNLTSITVPADAFPVLTSAEYMFAEQGGKAHNLENAFPVLKDAHSMFYANTNVKAVPKMQWSTIEDTSNMFENCNITDFTNLATADLSNLKKSEYMFRNASNSATIDLTPLNPIGDQEWFEEVKARRGFDNMFKGISTGTVTYPTWYDTSYMQW